jgi:anti-sigma B factor antagonist
MTAEPSSPEALPGPEVSADDFDVLVIKHDDAVVVSVRGEIDVATAPRLGTVLAEAIPEAKQRLVIDLHDTTFIDSTALTVFVRAFKQLRRHGAELVLRAPRKNARTVLNVTGLDKVITIES